LSALGGPGGPLGTPNGLIFHPWAVSGRSCGTQGPPESSKDPSDLEGESVLEPFLDHFGVLLVYIFAVFLIKFSTSFFKLFCCDFEANFADIFGSKSSSGAPRQQRVDLLKHRFSGGKTIVFEVGGCPGAVQIELRIVFGTLLVFSSILEPKSKPKRVQNGSRKAPKSIPKFNCFWNLFLKQCLEPKRTTVLPHLG